MQEPTFLDCCDTVSLTTVRVLPGSAGGLTWIALQAIGDVEVIRHA